MSEVTKSSDQKQARAVVKGEAIAFEVSLDWESEAYGKESAGWSMVGWYKTSTDAKGESTLQISATLRAPEELSRQNNHYAVWALGSYARSITEWYWAGWEPQSSIGDSPPPSSSPSEPNPPPETSKTGFSLSHFTR